MKALKYQKRSGNDALEALLASGLVRSGHRYEVDGITEGTVWSGRDRDKLVGIVLLVVPAPAMSSVYSCGERDL